MRAEKTKRTYKDGQDQVLAEVSACFEGAEKFINKDIAEICAQDKNIGGRGNLFFVCFCVFSVMVYCYLAFSIKIVVCYAGPKALRSLCYN